MSDVQGQLEEIGINARNSSGELKNALDIYQEVADAMEKGTLTTEEFNKAALALGGRRHVTRVTALIESMQSINGEQSLFQKQLEDSMNSVGSAARENLVYMNSISAKQRQLIANAQELAATSGEVYLEQAYRDLLSTLEGLTQTANSVVKEFGLLPPIFGAISTAVVLFSSRITSAKTYTNAYGAATAWLGLRLESLSTSFHKARTASQAATAGMSGFSKATKGATVAVTTFGRAIKGALISTGIGVGIVVLTTLIGKFIEKSTQARAEQRKFREEMDKMVITYDQNESKVKSLVNRYEELKNKATLSNKEQKEFRQLQNELADILPNTVDNIDEQGNAHLRNVEAIREEIDELNRLSQLRAEEFVAIDYSKQVDKLKSEISDFQSQINDIKFDQVGSNFGGFTNIEKELTAEEELKVGYLENKVSSLKDSMSDLDAEYSQSFAKVKDMNSKLTNEQLDFVKSISNTVDESEDATGQIEDFVKKVVGLNSTLSKSIDPKTINSLSKEQIDMMNNYVNALDEQEQGHKDANKAVESYKSQLVETTDGHNLIRIATNAHTESLQENTVANDQNTDAQDKNEKQMWEKADAAQVLTGITAEQTEKIKQAIQVVQLLSRVENLNAQQKEMLSGATNYLAEMYPHLSDNIAGNIDMIAAEMQMMGQLNQASGSNANIMMTNQDNITKSTIDASNQRIKALMNEYDALKQVMNRHIQANKAIDGVVPETGFMHYVHDQMGDVQAELSKAYNTRREAIYGLSTVERPDIDAYTGRSSDSYGGSGSSGGSSSTPKSEEEKIADAQRKAWEEAQEALIPYIDNVDKVKHEIELLRIKRGQMEEGSKEYIDSMNWENKLLSDQRKANKEYRKELNRLVKTENLSKDKKRELSDRVSQLSLDYHKLEQSIYDNNKALDEFAKKVEQNERDVFQERTTAADRTIDALKEYHQTRLKFIEAEKQAELDSLDEQLSKYEKYVNDKLQMLDRTQSEEDYQNEREKLQDGIASLRREMDIRSLNNTQESKAKQEELQRELNEKILDLESLKDSRKRELRKQNYNDQLEQYRKETQDKKEQVQTELEAERYKVQELLNNERHWSDMRNKIISGSVDAITSKLKKSAKEINDYTKNYTKQTIEDMGISFNNLLNQIDRVKEATKQVKNSSKGEFNKDGLIYEGQRYKLGEFNNPSSDKDKMTIIRDGKGYSYDDYVDALLDGDIASYDTGGMTPSFSGDGKLIKAHEKEIILNQKDSSNFVKALGITRDIFNNLIPKFDAKSLAFNSPTPSTSGGTHIDINIDKVVGTDQKTADNFASSVRDSLFKKGLT